MNSPRIDLFSSSSSICSIIGPIISHPADFYSSSRDPLIYHSSIHLEPFSARPLNLCIELCKLPFFSTVVLLINHNYCQTTAAALKPNSSQVNPQINLFGRKFHEIIDRFTLSWNRVMGQFLRRRALYRDFSEPGGLSVISVNLSSSLATNPIQPNLLVCSQSPL